MKTVINYIFRNSWWLKSKRPKVKTRFKIFDLIMEIAGVAAVISLWIFLMTSYSNLPDVIPFNFNTAGQADGFDNKSKIFILPVIATALFVVMTILSRFPHFFNYPVKITENNAQFQYENMTRMLRLVKLSLVLVFGCIVFQTIRTATGNADGLGVWLLPTTLAIIFIPVIYFAVKSFIYR